MKRTNTLLLTLLMFSMPVAADGWWDSIKNAIFGEETSATLSDDKIAKGLKETLQVGTQSVIDSLSKPGGFANDSNLHIDLPSGLQKVKSALDKVGKGHWITDLEAKLNQAAEKAVPAAGPLLMDAIKKMDISDIQGLYNGKSDSITSYFKQSMSGPIGESLTPIIKQSLESVGAASTYEKIMKQYNALPFVKKVDSDISSLVKSQALDGIFDRLATEEAAIRKDPAKQTTNLLKQLFSKE